jgi:general secretion pathway protein G
LNLVKNKLMIITNNKRNVKYSQRGITLIQTLVLVGIVGIVILIFTVLLAGERKKSRDNIRVANIKQVQAALELFYSQNGSYPSTASGPTRGNSGHNWLPNMEDHGITDTFNKFLPQELIAPLPADSAICRASKPCNGDTAAVANDFCYTAYPAGCSAAGDVKCNDFLLDFCLGKNVGGLSAGRHSITKTGMK